MGDRVYRDERHLSWYAFEEFKDPDAVVYFYPVGYSNADKRLWLWKPGVSPHEEYKRVVRPITKEKWKRAFVGGGEDNNDIWDDKFQELSRVPDGAEATEIVELLFTIQHSQSLRNGSVG
jgi:hypothetical protein